MPTTNSYTEGQKGLLLASLRKTLGIVSVACRAIESDATKAENLRQRHYYWMGSDQDYKKAVEGIADIALDFAESKLHKQIEKEDTTATIFYLKTKGKGRGYIERNEFTGKDGGPIESKVESTLSLDERLSKALDAIKDVQTEDHD